MTEHSQESPTLQATDSHFKNTKAIYGSRLVGLDGDIGHVRDLLFEDDIWVIRYVIADTGNWLPGRLVLLSPYAFGQSGLCPKVLNVGLRKAEIEGSPVPGSYGPVSRQYEIEYFRHYGWPAYWVGDAMWGVSGCPVVALPAQEEVAPEQRYQHRDDRHLQSTRGLAGYAIEATDGRIGHVKAFLFDERSWAIRDLVVETGHWYSGKEILLPTGSVKHIRYDDEKVVVTLTRAEIQKTAEHGIARTDAERIQAR